MDAQPVPSLIRQSIARQNQSSLSEVGRTTIAQSAYSLEPPQHGSIASDVSSLRSKPGSVSGQSLHSSRSVFLDDIKHEIMVNHIYQQQCSHLWVSDGSGEREGVLLRKSRGHYLACPQPLLDSNLARMCTQLNVQVRRTSRYSCWKLTDRRLPSQ